MVVWVQLRKVLHHRVFNEAALEMHVLGAYQQAGKLWPFNNGAAMWVGGSLQMWQALRLQLGWWKTQDFVTLYGSPFGV